MTDAVHLPGFCTDPTDRERRIEIYSTMKNTYSLPAVIEHLN